MIPPEILQAFPQLASMTVQEAVAWLETQQAEARVELEMHTREEAEGRAAFEALEPYMNGFRDRTTAEALAIMRKVEGADSPKVQAVETFVANHPWMKIKNTA